MVSGARWIPRYDAVSCLVIYQVHSGNIDMAECCHVTRPDKNPDLVCIRFCSSIGRGMAPRLFVTYSTQLGKCFGSKVAVATILVAD